MTTGAKPVTVTDDTFQSEVLESEQPVLVDLWATWCPPCRQLAPVIDELAEQFEGRAKVAKVDVDSSRETARRYGVQSIPTLLFFKGGELVEQLVGAQPRQVLASKLEELSAS